MFNSLKQDDPFLGKGTWGQTSRFGSVRLYVMHKKLSELEGDGWKKNKHFKKFVECLQGVGFGDIGISYFQKTTETFFERYRFVFNKWMVSKWRSSDILHYMLAGDAEHATEFARWIVDYKETVDAQPSPEDADEDTIFEIPPYMFQDKTVTLGKHHQMNANEPPIQVNLRTSMDYLTQEADRATIIKEPFVVDNWRLISSMADSPIAVELFKKNDDESGLHRLTWGTVDYEPLMIQMIKKICPHSNHQQRVENGVQMTGLVGKTGVAEVRRTIRAIILSSAIRPFNTWALEEKNRMNAARGKPVVNRLQGSDKPGLLLTYIDKHVFSKAGEGKRALEAYEAICDRLEDGSSKASAKETEKKVHHFENTLKADPKRQVKAEKAAGVEKTAHISEAFYTRLLVDTKSSFLPGDTRMKDIANAEIKARGIKISDTTLNGMTLAEKRKELNKDELKERVGAGETELKLGDITYIKPQSKEMIDIMKNVQQQILDKDMGITRIEESFN